MKVSYSATRMSLALIAHDSLVLAHPGDGNAPGWPVIDRRRCIR
jgi:hypothetical protein